MSRGVLGTSVLIASDVQPLPGHLAISVISLAELHYGVLVAKSGDARATRLARLAGLQKRFDPLPVDDAVAESYGRLAAKRTCSTSFPSDLPATSSPYIARRPQRTEGIKGQPRRTSVNPRRSSATSIGVSNCSTPPPSAVTS